MMKTKRIAGIGLASMFWLGFSLTSPGLAQGARPATGQQRQARPATWPTERAGMLKQVVDRGWSQVRAVRTMAEIGTMSQADVRASEAWFATLEKQVDADAQVAASRPDPAPVERSTLRIRFAEAMNAVDAAEVRFDNGMISTAAMNASLTAAAAVFLGSAAR